MSSEYAFSISKKFDLQKSLKLLSGFGISLYPEADKIKSFNSNAVDYKYTTLTELEQKIREKNDINFHLYYENSDHQFSCHLSYDKKLEHYTENYNLSWLTRDYYFKIVDILVEKSIKFKEEFQMIGLAALTYDSEFNPEDFFVNSDLVSENDTQYITHLFFNSNKLNCLKDSRFNAAELLDENFMLYRQKM